MFNNYSSQLLLNQLMMKNPRLFQQVEQLRKNGGNPIELFKQITSGYSQEQMNNLFNQAKSMGFGDDLINQLKGGVDTQSDYIEKGE